MSYGWSLDQIELTALTSHSHIMDHGCKHYDAILISAHRRIDFELSAHIRTNDRKSLTSEITCHIRDYMKHLHIISISDLFIVVMGQKKVCQLSVLLENISDEVTSYSNNKRPISFEYKEIHGSFRVFNWNQMGNVLSLSQSPLWWGLHVFKLDRSAREQVNGGTTSGMDCSKTRIQLAQHAHRRTNVPSMRSWELEERMDLSCHFLELNSKAETSMQSEQSTFHNPLTPQRPPFMTCCM